MIFTLVRLVLKFLLTIIRVLTKVPFCLGKCALRSPLYILRFLHPINLTCCLVRTVIKTTLLVGVLAVAAYNYEAIARVVCPNPAKSAVFPFEDREWTTKPASGNTAVVPFSVAVPEAVLEDLKRRLDNTRYGPPMDGVNFEYGFPPSQLKSLVDYWRNSFSWKKQEAVLNQHPQFKTEIEGLDIHFVHVKPQADPDTRVLPLILLHGFPGSYFELYKLIPLLTASRSFKTNSTTDPNVNVVFEVIVPSLPGFGFSDAPQVPGLESGDIARIMHKLMVRLGHSGYVVHGGDWGSSIGRSMALMYPKNVKGLELTLYPIPMGAALAKGALGLATSTLLDLFESRYPGMLGDQLALAKSKLHDLLGAKFSALLDVKLPGSCISKLVMDPAESDKIIWKNFKFLLKGTGFMHFQATRPDTVGAGVTDSPAGLAAYILDLFSGATNAANLEKADGGLKEYYSMDDLLTNVMIYWVSGSIMSSQRLYKENFGSSDTSKRFGYVVTVPTVLSDFPHEVRGGNPPSAFVKPYFKNLVDIRKHDSCGHFPGLECPKELAEDIWALVTKFVTKPLASDKSTKN